MDRSKKRYMVSHRKVLGQCLFLLSKTWRNKKFPELHHEVLGDLSISRSPAPSLFSTNKNMKSAKTTIYTKLFIGHK